MHAGLKQKKRSRQVCVQPRPPVVNTTLLALAAKYRAADLLLSAGACY